MAARVYITSAARGRSGTIGIHYEGKSINPLVTSEYLRVRAAHLGTMTVVMQR